MPASNARPTTSVVVTCFNQARYLGAALQSVRNQTVPASDVVVVDDGSTDDTAAVAAAFEGIRLIQQPNLGPSAARNAGMNAATGEFVIFLDGDDQLLPRAIEAGVGSLAGNPEAAFAYGRFRDVDTAGVRRPSGLRGEIGQDMYAELLRRNVIAMHATVTYRRTALLAVGGFDETLEACEDYALYLRLARQYPVVAHDEIVAEYHWHDSNRSDDHMRMLTAALSVVEQQRPYLDTDARRKAWADGRRQWVRRYAPGAVREIRSAVVQQHWRRGVGRVLAFARLTRAAAIPISVQKIATRWRRRQVAAGAVRWGSLRRHMPFSAAYGFDRGQPIDRYYIDKFLREFAGDIRGHVLEIGDDLYTRTIANGNVTRSDILHVNASNPRATIVADLADAAHIPSNTFDCIILTQTLHLIYDLTAAVCTLHRILKPGGVVLATVPGITPLGSDEWSRTWYWSLTELSARRLFESVFGRPVITYSAGNVVVATAFLYGLATEELTTADLDHFDSRYPVTIGIRATK